MKKLRQFAVPLVLVLGAACTPVSVETTGAQSVAPIAPVSAPFSAPLPAFPRLGSALPAGHTAYDNDSLARLFTVMALELEGRARRPYLVRYETAISVGVEGLEGEGINAFLDEFLGNLRRNSNIAISRGSAPDNLHIRFVDGDRFDKTLKSANCVIAQGNVSWKKFSADPLQYSARNAARALRIEQMTIFIPNNAPPYLMRNCLLEEVPQALGLSNDLFGLGDSSFNDDGAHVWPTKLDYLMLRVLYAPEMITGLDRRETRNRALALLNSFNPAGRNAPPLPSLNQRSLAEWSYLISRVFTRGASQSNIREDVEKALQIVRAVAPGSPQYCYTLVTAGRVLSRPDPERALLLLDQARQVCNEAHGVSDIRLARIQLEEACALQRLGRYDEVVAVAENIWPVLAAHGQDRPLAALYTLQSEALDEIEPGSKQAATVRRLAAEWNAYAMGPGRRAAGCRKKT
jgi:Protein of unknown function (DUF2927)